jgi:hypothetical protein
MQGLGKNLSRRDPAILDIAGWGSIVRAAELQVPMMCTRVSKSNRARPVCRGT